MKNKKILFWSIVLIAIVSLVVILTKPTKLGLDLVGGSRLVLEAQTTDNIAKITPDMMDSLLFAIENRINKLGVAETIVQKAGEKRLLIEIPNVSDPKKAREFLGETAELEFKKPAQVVNGVQTWQSVNLTGKDLRRSALSTSTTGEWVVDLEFNDEGTKKFAKLTQTLVGQPMAIFFNGEMTSAPVIREAILGGRAQISGGDNGFAYEEAKRMVDLLNAGALPVPAKIIEENTVGPT
jgi:preprotein translocase subunit SecD